MSVTNDEARECAARVARYLGGGESLDKIYGHIHPDELGVYHADNRKLILWAIAELARRDAVQAERNLPIDEEWCLRNGGRRDDAGGVSWKIWEVGQDESNEEPAFHVLLANGSVWLECYDTAGDTLGLIELFAAKQRGQLDDLLNALKGGAT